jgi:hypothetical protein
MSRRLWKLVFLFVSVFVLGGGGYLVSRFWNWSGSLSQAFIDARAQSAIIAQNIVDLSNQSAGDLGKVSELDQKGDYTEALTMTTDLVRKSQDIRDQAVALSSQVETMTRELSSINSTEARQAALESIASRLALISRLINYSGYLGQLLDSLRNRFSGKGLNNQNIQPLVDQINSEINAINNFNNQAGQSMERFDKLIKQ